MLSHRFGLRHTSNLEIVAATPEIDHVVIVGILENAREVAIAQTLAVMAEQFASLGAHHAGAHGGISRGKGSNGATEEIERFVARESFAACANRLRRVGARRTGSAVWTRRTNVWRGCRCRRYCRDRLGCNDRHGCVWSNSSRVAGDHRLAVERRLAWPVWARTIIAIASTAATTATASASRRLVTGRSRWHFGARRFIGSGILGRPCVALRAARQTDFELAILQLGGGEETALHGVLHEARELRHAEILLVERAVNFLHHLLEAIGAHHIAIALHAADRLGDEFPWVPLFRGLVVVVLHEAGERVVAVVLVTVHDEQIAGRLANADADDVFAILLELVDEAREVAVAGEQDVGADLRAREDELDGVNGEPDVGRVLLGRPVGGREDHVDRRLGERDDVLRVAAPVGVGALDGDFALDDLGAEQRAQLLSEVGANPHRDVVEVDEEGGVRRVHLGRVIARTGAWRAERLGSSVDERGGGVRRRVPRGA